MTPSEIIAQAIEEQTAVNHTADALSSDLAKRVQRNDTAGISDIVRQAVDTLDRNPEVDREETGVAGVVDGGTGAPDD